MSEKVRNVSEQTNFKKMERKIKNTKMLKKNVTNIKTVKKYERKNKY